jgi:PKD repeat protein
MTSLPNVYCIHCSDAGQHLARIEQLAQKLRDQNRIAGLVSLVAEEVDDGFIQRVERQDLIIVLLTTALEKFQGRLGPLFSQVKNKYANLPIAEILIDNIRYENAYITLPTDLRPIRDRENMDQIWSEAEATLSDLIPKPQPISKRKFLIPAIVVAVVGLLIWLVPKISLNGDPEPDFNFTVRDINNGRRVSDSSACYLPCLVSLNSTSKNVDSVRWTLNDTITLKETSTDYPLLVAGKYKVELTAMKGDKKKPLTKTFLVKATPSFEAGNDGCIAPCKITFMHSLVNVKSFNWDFGDGTNSNAATPVKEYSAPKDYKVVLTVTYEDDLKKSTLDTVTTRVETTPFAQFTIVKGGVLGQVPRNVTFQNASQNAEQYIWNFGDGTNGITNAGSPNITHKYNGEGTYTVVLTAKLNNKESTSAKSFYIGPLEKMVHWPIKDISVYKKIDESPAIKKRVMKDYRVVQP